MSYVPFRCKGCANTERVGHLIKGQRCDVGEIISEYGCSRFTPDNTASCQDCYYNPNVPKSFDHKCNATGEYINSAKNYCQHYAERQEKSGRKGGCFVTTAVCNVLGHPDDCETLTTLRYFRDNFLLPSKFSYLVDDYYARSERIVNYINNSSNAIELSQHIHHVFLQNIVFKIKQGAMEEVINDYKSMVEYLESLIEYFESTNRYN